MKRVNICFFRNVFRLHDNASLHHAIHSTPSAQCLLPLVCLDPRMMDLSCLNDTLGTKYTSPTTWHFGLTRCDAPRTRFILESVLDLKQQLKERHSDLMVLYGEPETLLPQLDAFLKTQGWTVQEVHTHKEYAWEELAIEDSLNKAYPTPAIQYHHDTTMVHPDDVNFSFQQTSRVFTPFRKRIEAMATPVRPAFPALPSRLPAYPSTALASFQTQEALSIALDGFSLFPSFERDPRSAYPWQGGETQALARLHAYVSGTQAVVDYKQTRNGLIGTDYSTKLSAFLAHGCVSPRTVWHTLVAFEKKRDNAKKKRSTTTKKEEQPGTYWVQFEMLWRDYWRYLVAGHGRKVFFLHGFRKTVPPPGEVDVQSKRYSGVWLKDPHNFDLWCQGKTGIPFIDACMRELRTTGFMSNRGRQNAASFLAKDLHLDWRMGAEWYESMLLDHDVYSNYGNWQYVSGIGCDPRESIRHFNIIKQAKDYDPEGAYVKLWCPELKDVPALKIHAPWTMTPEEETKANCRIGQDYPKPMIVVAAWEKHYAVKGGAKVNGNKHEKVKKATSDATPKLKQRKLVF
ncbi:DNA photolyase, FAD-binding/Cryptochrome [Spinellus fusiger]|nr:DNA photolyase, FAD-binding/Cryptochrome [Spinellus fusiger]